MYEFKNLNDLNDKNLINGWVLIRAGVLEKTSKINLSEMGGVYLLGT